MSSRSSRERSRGRGRQNNEKGESDRRYLRRSRSRSPPRRHSPSPARSSRSRRSPSRLSVKDDRDRRFHRSPSHNRYFPSPSRSIRSRRSPSQPRQHVEDYRDRKIRELENQLLESEAKIKNYKSSALILEQRLQVAIESRSVMAAKTSLDEAKMKESKVFDRLNMQVQTQAILLRKFNDDNQQLIEELVSSKNRLETMKYYLKDAATQLGQIKGEWASLSEIGLMLANFKVQFDQTRGLIQSMCESASFAGGTEVVNQPAKSDGKILVDQRHLKDLLATIMFHMQGIAQNCCDVIQGNPLHSVSSNDSNSKDRDTKEMTSVDE